MLVLDSHRTSYIGLETILYGTNAGHNMLLLESQGRPNTSFDLQ